MGAGRVLMALDWALIWLALFAGLYVGHLWGMATNHCPIECPACGWTPEPVNDR